MENKMIIPLRFDENTLKAVEEVFVKVAEKVKNDVIQGNHVKQYLNKKEAAEYLGVSFNTLKKFEKEGLPIVEVAGMQLIRRVDIDKFLEENIVKS